MLSAAKPKLNPIIIFFAKPFKNVDPNILTFLGLLPPILFVYLMLTGHYIWALVSFLGVFFDTLDGAVARMSGKTSEFGGVLDSTFDRIADSLYIMAFVFVGFISPVLGFSTLLLSYLISYIRSRAELAGNARFKLDVGIIERPERLVFLALALIAARFFENISFYGWSLVELVFLLLIMLSLVTVAQRLRRAAQLLR